MNDSERPTPDATRGTIFFRLETGQTVLSAVRCTACNARRLENVETGYLSACSFLECPDPLADALRERALRMAHET